MRNESPRSVPNLSQALVALVSPVNGTANLRVAGLSVAARIAAEAVKAGASELWIVGEGRPPIARETWDDLSRACPELVVSALSAAEAEARLTDEPLRLLVRRMADDVGAEGFVRQQKAIMKRPDSRPSLAGLSLSTLVLVGEEDVITPIDEAREMAGLVGPKARLAVLPGCGHLSTLEDPERVTAELARWLA